MTSSPSEPQSDHHLDDGDDEPASGFGDVAGAIGAKNLKIAIVVMPFIFMFITVLLVIIFRKPDDAPVVDSLEAALAADQQALEETSSTPQATVGGVVTSGAIALDGDRLAVRMRGGDGDEVVVYDITTGEVIARVPLNPKETP